MHLRLAEYKDSLDILRWRNDALTQLMSRSQHVISVEDHNKWFASVLDNPDWIFLIGEISNESLGMVRFQHLKNTEQWEISINLAPEFRKQGHSKELLKLAIAYFRSRYKTNEIIAQIKNENLASKKLFIGAGFSYNFCIDDMLCFTFKNHSMDL